MIIKEEIDREYWFDENKTEPNEEAMISKLLDDLILFPNTRKYICISGAPKKDTIVLFVNCNDVFAWGCGDAEPITLDEIVDLFRLYELNPHCAVVQWVCVKRNEKPQAPIIKFLKEKNRWNDILENLPENQYDKLMKEKYGQPK